MQSNSKKDVQAATMNSADKTFKRRAFLKYTGMTASAAALIMAGCSDDSVMNRNTNGNTNGNAKTGKNGKEAVDLGSGDIGILNYAYALEQLEAAFYTMVVADGAFSSAFSDEEQRALSSIKDHEVVHRDFLKAALAGNAIRDLEVDFSAIDFSSRASVMGTAKVFEDLGVAAYNGAGKLIEDANYLLIAGKIVSVEARHAAAIRDFLHPLSADFAGDDVVDSNGLDRALMPADVLAAAGTYIMDTIDASHLPTM